MFYVSILQLAPCSLLLLHRNGATWESQEGAAPRAPTAGLVLPQFLPSILKKHYSIFTSKSWMVWFVSLEPSIKEATFFLLFLLSSIYRSGCFFWQLSSTQADLAEWTCERMHSDRILLPKWNVGICYAPQIEKWPRNQDLKGDI